MQCSAPGCEFKTPENIPTYEQCLQSLSLHVTAAHAVQPTAAAASKPDKLKRPTVTDGVTEADWVWFEDRWTRYKDSTGLEGVNVVNQLWDCASEDLAWRCYEAGPSKDITEKDLLARMKRLAIKAQNKLVNIVEFLSMTQDTDEPVAMFLSRLQGQASVCDFTVKCSENAAVVHSYADNMVAHQLVRGLEDITQQEKVLALAATEKDLSLKKISEFVEAQETGLRSSKILGGGAGVQKINSDYRRIRNNERLNHNERCDYCGIGGHGKRPSLETRKEKCPAYGEQCHRCEALGHFARRCKKRFGKDKNEDEVSDDNDNDGQAGMVADVFSFSAMPAQGHGQRRHYTGQSKTKKIGKWNIATSGQSQELIHSQGRRHGEYRKARSGSRYQSKWSRLEIGDIVSMGKWGWTGIIVDVLPYNQYRVQREDSGQTIVKDRPALRRVGHTDTGSSAQWVRSHLDPTIQDDTAQWETEHGETLNYGTSAILEVF